VLSALNSATSAVKVLKKAFNRRERREPIEIAKNYLSISPKTISEVLCALSIKLCDLCG
jgi:hypothetical protein